jgi:cyclophilin family peptidyl-prolyl cis-trans isomerase
MRQISRRVLLGAAVLAVCGACTALAPSAEAQKKPTANPRVELQIQGRGKVVVELFKKDAPKTVTHFTGLVKRKFYDGILFHRVIGGFVAQAGDPGSKKLKSADLAKLDDNQVAQLGLGGGGSGKNIPFETNERAHETGTLAMALSAPRSATGDSQFFINLNPNHQLDGDYCVFGKVVSGMDVVKKIKRGDKIQKATLK